MYFKKALLSLTFILPIRATETKIIELKKNQDVPKLSAQLQLIKNDQVSNGADIVIDKNRMHVICTSANMTDYSLGVFDYEGNPQGSLNGHTDTALCLTIPKDDPDTLISGGWKEIIVWSLSNNTNVRTLKPASQVYCILSLGNNLVAAGGGDIETQTSDLVIWNINTGAPLRCFGHTSPVWRLTEIDMSYWEQNNWFVSSANGDTRIWDLKGNPIKQINGGGGSLVTLEDSKNNDQLLFIGGTMVTYLSINPEQFGNEKYCCTDQNWINVIRFSADKKRMFTGGRDCRIVISDITNLDDIQTIATCNGHYSPINDILLWGSQALVSVSGLNDWSQYVDNTVRVWDLNGNQLAQTENDTSCSTLHNIKQIESSPKIAVGALYALKLYNLEFDPTKFTKTADEKKENTQPTKINRADFERKLAAKGLLKKISNGLKQETKPADNKKTEKEEDNSGLCNVM